MAGRLNKAPYPSDAMTDVFHVTDVGSTLALTVADPDLITIENSQTQPQPQRPSIVGDVLSRKPGGSWIGRPAGTNGPWEQQKPNGLVRVYNPEPGGKAEGFVYWDVANE